MEHSGNKHIWDTLHWWEISFLAEAAEQNTMSITAGFQDPVHMATNKLTSTMSAD